jgi:hypothetical protein
LKDDTRYDSTRLNRRKIKTPNMTDSPRELSSTFISSWKDGIKAEKIRIRVGICKTVLNRYKQKLIGASIALRTAECFFFTENLYPINTKVNTIKSNMPKTAIKIAV